MKKRNTNIKVRNVFRCDISHHYLRVLDIKQQKSLCGKKQTVVVVKNLTPRNEREQKIIECELPTFERLLLTKIK